MGWLTWIALLNMFMITILCFTQQKMAATESGCGHFALEAESSLLRKTDSHRFLRRHYPDQVPRVYLSGHRAGFPVMTTPTVA
jgi:hypothetical protein